MPAEAQHLRHICALPAGVNARTTSGFCPQKRQMDCAAFAAARAVTSVFDFAPAFAMSLLFASVFFSLRDSTLNYRRKCPVCQVFRLDLEGRASFLLVFPRQSASRFCNHAGIALSLRDPVFRNQEG